MPTQNAKQANIIILTFLGILMIIALTGIIATTIIELKKQDCRIDLPEEIHNVTRNDTLRGYYDKSGVLHIEFNNARNQGL